MTKLKTLVAAVLMATISTPSVVAQAGMSEPAAFQSMYPNRDVLNGGAPTPAGRMGLELPDGAAGSYAATNAYARMGSASPSFCAQRYHSYDPATGSFLGHDGRRHSCR
jgi:hypothetical protein